MTTKPTKLSELNPNDYVTFLDQNRANGFADLPAKHRLFALEYIKVYDHRSAAVVAGFDADKGIRLLREPLVAEFIADLRQKKEHVSLIDAAFIEVQYLNVLGKLLGEEDIAMVDSDGISRTGRRFHASETVSALRDMAKIAGLHKADGASVNVNVNLGAVNLTAEQKALLDKALDSSY